MSRSFITLAALSIAVATPFISLQAQAVQRTHVSAAFGSDANTATNCAAAAPCRFFQAAMTVTDTNGEVIVLDSGGYGAVTITKSLALIAPTGVYAGISVFPGANGVTIATLGVNVVLRGLTINGQGGNNGINMTAGNSLTVENCVISNLTGNGIDVDGATVFNVTDTIVRRNSNIGIILRNGAKANITRVGVSGSGDAGIRVQGFGANTATIVDIADSTVNGNFYGVYSVSENLTALINVTVRDSRAVRNSGFGLLSISSLGAAVSLSASNNIVANNGTGIAGGGAGSKIWLSGNTVSDNPNNGLLNISSGAVFETAGNNAVRNNGGNSGTITTVAPQ